MRIYSKFVDYYDSISGQYLDKEIVFRREKKFVRLTPNELKPLANLKLLKYKIDGASESYQFCEKILGFCGELFPLIVIQDELSFPVKCFFNFDELASFVKQQGIDDEPFNFKHRHTWPGIKRGYVKGFLSESFEFFKRTEPFGQLKQYFEMLQVPIFLVGVDEVCELEFTANPRLKDFEFQRIKDPFTTHQTIYQFIAARLHQPVNPMVEISDIDKIAKHGFDKFSFRKLPSKKKGKTRK